MTFPQTRKVVAPNDKPKETNTTIIEDRRGVKFQNESFPLRNLVRFSPKAENFFQVNPDCKQYIIKASAHIPYDSMPFHQVIDLIRRTNSSNDPGRENVNLKVTGLSLSQIVQIFWFCQVLDLTEHLSQEWIGKHIIEQFSKDQGVAQLDVAALNTILRLCSAKGKIHPAAVSSMARKVNRGSLSAAELEKLVTLREEFPQYDARLAANGAPAPAAVPAPQTSANGGSRRAPRPVRSPDQPKLTYAYFPPLGGGR